MWQEIDDKFQRDFQFSDFKQAFAFMTEVAFHAEIQGHHPAWSNVYNHVFIALSTHDAGNIITEKDRTLAEAIDEVYKKYSVN